MCGLVTRCIPAAFLQCALRTTNAIPDELPNGKIVAAGLRLRLRTKQDVVQERLNIVVFVTVWLCTTDATVQTRASRRFLTELLEQLEQGHSTPRSRFPVSDLADQLQVSALDFCLRNKLAGARARRRACRVRRPLPHVQAAVKREVGTRREAGLVTGNPRDNRRNFRGFTETAHWDARDYSL